MKYRCIKDMYYHGDNRVLGFKKGKYYELKGYKGSYYLVDDSGDENVQEGNDSWIYWLNEYFELDGIKITTTAKSYELNEISIGADENMVYGFNDELCYEDIDDMIAVLYKIKYDFYRR